MSDTNLLTIRKERNLTQEELSEKSGISLRTIQRIEAGTPPKGYTLKTLAMSLGVSEEVLSGRIQIDHSGYAVARIINLSSLLFIFFPPLNFLVPLIIMILKKQYEPIVKRIVSLQLLWTLVGVVLLLVIYILNDWFAVQSRVTISLAIIWMLINGVIIVCNAAALTKGQNPKIIPGINIL